MNGPWVAFRTFVTRMLATQITLGLIVPASTMIDRMCKELYVVVVFFLDSSNEGAQKRPLGSRSSFPSEHSLLARSAACDNTLGRTCVSQTLMHHGPWMGPAPLSHSPPCARWKPSAAISKTKSYKERLES